MAYPKIVYNPTGSLDVTLPFTYPPVQKPMIDDREAVRNDSITTSGLQQSIVERVDIIKVLQMDNVPWADLPSWEPFIDFAITGAEFQYYPDADLPSFKTYQLVDTKFKPAFNIIGLTKFTLNMRVAPDGPSA